MNPRQRRGVLLLGLAFLGAIAVFVAVASYVSGVRKNVTPEADTYVLTRAVAAQQPVLPSMLRLQKIPRKFLSERAITDPAVIGQRVAGQPIPAGAQLSEGMLVDPPAVPAGQREFAISVSADTGVAGKIQPGDLVDITAAFAGDQRSVPRSRTIISRARIITVGVPRTRESQAFATDQDNGSSNAATGGDAVVPVTFAFTRREVQVAEYAQAFATEVRLSLIPADESSTSKKNPNEYTLPATQRRAQR